MFRGIILFSLLSMCVTIRGYEPEKEVIAAINKLDSEPSLEVLGGLRINKLEHARIFEPANNVLERVEQYFESHKIQWDVPSEEAEEESRGHAVAVPRTRRLRKMLMPLLLLFKLKMSVIIKLALIVIKFISLKALALSILALLFSGSALLKDLISKKKDVVTTAYIAGAPLNAEIVHTDWNRNGQASAHDLAYNYHTIPQQTF